MGKILSVYVENEGMRVCEVAKSGGNMVVKNAFDVPMPSGTVEDGMINDVEDAAKTLYAALKNNKIKRGKIAFVISSKRIANKEIVIPYMKNQKKIDEIIKANVDDYFPMNNLDDYIFRYNILDTFENAEGKHYSILVMAFQKQMVEVYYQLASMMKMPVVTVDYYGNSIYQLLKKQLNQGTVLAIHMDRNASEVSIMRGKAQVFKRSIPYGRNTVIRNLSELKGMTEEEAEETLEDPRKLDLELTPDEYSEVIRDFSSSVTRVAEFHTSRNPGTTIELVKLMGTGINLIGFPQVLGRELGIEVTVIKELAGVKIARKNPAGLNFEKIVDYLPNIGALIQPLDLKVEEEKKKSGSYTIFYVLIAAAVLANLSVAGFMLWQLDILKQEKARLEQSIAAVQDSEAVYDMYNRVKADYQVLADYYDNTKNNNEMLYQMVLDLEQVMPESVGITNFTAENGEVSITGTSGGKDALAKFIIELKKIPYISNVRVENIADTYDSFDNSTSTFNMVFRLNLQETEEDGNETESVG